MEKVRYWEEVGRLQTGIYKVRRTMKGGWSEEAYHQAYVCALEEEGIPLLSKPRQPLLHRGHKVHEFKPDIIVWDLIALELKALPYQQKFIGANFAQIIHYLKFWKLNLGLLINFGPPKVIVKRVLWDEPPFKLSENYKQFPSDLSELDRHELDKIRRIIISLGKEYGLGYPEAFYRNLLAIEASYHNLSCQNGVIVTATWNGRKIASHKTSHLLIADKYLVHIRSLLHHPTRHDYVATKTYLGNLGLRFAFIVNFAPKELQIEGVRADGSRNLFSNLEIAAKST